MIIKGNPAPGAVMNSSNSRASSDAAGVVVVVKKEAAELGEPVAVKTGTPNAAKTAFGIANTMKFAGIEGVYDMSNAAQPVSYTTSSAYLSPGLTVYINGNNQDTSEQPEVFETDGSTIVRAIETNAEWVELGYSSSAFNGKWVRVTLPEISDPTHQIGVGYKHT